MRFIIGFPAVILIACSAICAASPATAPSTQPATQPTSDGQNPVRVLLEQWNQIPAEIERSKATPSAPKEVAFYNPLTRKNERAEVAQRRFALKHAVPQHVAESVRPLLTQGLGMVDYDQPHAEIVVTDRPATLKTIQSLVEAMDTPMPALVYRVPAANATMAEKIMRNWMTPQGKLNRVTTSTWVVSDGIEPLLKLEEAMRESRIRVNPSAASMRDTTWRETGRMFPQFPAQDPLRIDAPFGGEMVKVEQRTFPIIYASPDVAIEAARKVVTRGLGQVTYDPKTNLMAVTDQPEALQKFEAYLRELDTPKPARLIKVAPALVQSARAEIRKQLSPAGEIAGFDKDGVLIVRDETKALEAVELLEKMNKLTGANPLINQLNLPQSRPQAISRDEVTTRSIGGRIYMQPRQRQ